MFLSMRKLVNYVVENSQVVETFWSFMKYINLLITQRKKLHFHLFSSIAANIFTNIKPSL